MKRRCEYWDSGWCYAPKETDTNSLEGACQGTADCAYLAPNKEVHYQTHSLQHELPLYSNNKNIKQL